MKLGNRMWYLLSGIVVVVLVAGGWFLGAQPQLAAAASSQAQTTTAQSQNSQLTAQIGSLADASKSIDTLKATAAEFAAKIPDGVDGSDFIAQVSSVTSASGVTLTSLTLGTPRAYAPPVAASTAATSGTATASPSPSASAAAPVVTADEGASPLQASSVTASNFVIVPVTMQLSGPSAAKLLDFMAKLRAQPRLLLVTGLNFTQGDGGSATLAVTAQMYVLRSAS